MIHDIHRRNNLHGTRSHKPKAKHVKPETSVQKTEDERYIENVRADADFGRFYTPPRSKSGKKRSSKHHEPVLCKKPPTSKNAPTVITEEEFRAQWSFDPDFGRFFSS